MNKFFSEIKKNFGFGCMRLPMIGEDVDLEQFKQMVDLFMEAGFNYFDTAQVYIKGKSELAIKEAISKRYKRSDFILTDKLSGSCFKKEEDIIPFFNSQLEACGVDYFDFYLMHAQNADNFKFYKECHAYEHAFEFKKQGLVKHVGISFHDTADVLDKILTEYPQIEVVQIQFNYIDFDSAGIQSRLCYETCVKHKKPCIIMEPIKGGSLVNLPPEADKILKDLNNGSNASYALRFAAGFENNCMVLSGMSTLDQMKDNISFMKDFKPLNEKEMEALNKVIDIFKSKDMIPCTACRYCVDGCPKHIVIPNLFADMNEKTVFNGGGWYYRLHTTGYGKASDCIKCGKCERICPQKLPIRDLLVKVAETFETNN